MLADRHTANFLSAAVRHDNEESTLALVLRQFLRHNSSMRGGVVGTGKNGSRFVRVRLPLLMWK